MGDPWICWRSWTIWKLFPWVDPPFLGNPLENFFDFSWPLNRLEDKKLVLATKPWILGMFSNQQSLLEPTKLGTDVSWWMAIS